MPYRSADPAPPPRVLVLRPIKVRHVVLGCVVGSLIGTIGFVIAAWGAASAELLAAGSGLFVGCVGFLIAIMVVAARLRPKRLRIEGNELTIEQPRLVGATRSRTLVLDEIKEAFVDMRTKPDMDLEPTQSFRVALYEKSGEVVPLTDFDDIVDLEEARAFAGKVETFLDLRTRERASGS